MPDELKPCPNPLCAKSLPFAEAFKISCHTCGTSGAIHVDRDKSVAAWNALPRQPQVSTDRLQTIAASISGILDCSATADQCMATIERHVSRTGQKVKELMAENSALMRDALMRERDALKARLAGVVYDGTPQTLPPGGSIVVLKHHTRTCVARFVESWTNEMDDLWAIQLNFSEDLEIVAIGDTWWPLPGGGE